MPCACRCLIQSHSSLILSGSWYSVGIADAGIRIMLTGGYSADSYHPAKPNLVITCNAVRSTTQADFDKGLSAITYEYQRELAHIKSINYLMAVWLQPMLRVQQADDVIYFNKQSITEFPRSNVFIVTAAGKLITPAHNILQGITVKILSLADGIIEVEERDISVEELQQASEIFTTSTTKKVLPVVNSMARQSMTAGPAISANACTRNSLRSNKPLYSYNCKLKPFVFQEPVPGPQPATATRQPATCIRQPATGTFPL